ncbi:MAG: GNAT family N-acetyltransferase [Tissierellia bacterium]|nr:GNAT family N-acetyltransferase [Bacillota bacterium]NLL22717.1 GNAT family N-acetyltransferase [Tissierellia bacterium]
MITTTKQQEAVDALFLDQGLEMGNEPVDRNIQKIWIDMEDGELVGAATLGLREGHWVVDGIAVLPAYRKSKRGSRLLQKVVDEARNRGAARIWLVAKSPGFFEKEGFSYTDAEHSPPVFGCSHCDIRDITCHPRWMLKDLL